MVSLPAVLVNSKTSLPAPPVKVSFPDPPKRTSFPSPPIRVSVASDPQITSFPDPPLIVMT